MKYKKLLNFRRIIKNKFLHDENIHEESNENEKYLNEDILGEDYDEGGQASSLSSEPGRKKYVDDRKCLLDVLKGKLAVKKVTPELVRKICEKIEESQVLISQKRSETKINNKTLLNLKQQKKFLKIRKQTVTEYYKSILESYFCKLGGNCTRRSVYGTYKYSIRKLLKNSILVKLQDYTEDDPVRFYFGCDIPGVLLVSVNVHNQVFEENKFLFETVLKKKESQSITIGSCVFNPKGLLRLVNDCYFE